MIGQYRHGLPPEASATADGESLQTDVMRFMAIIGLCLTAIFALVQSLPSDKQAGPPPVAATEAEAQRAERLQRQLDASADALRGEQQRRHLAEQTVAMLVGERQARRAQSRPKPAQLPAPEPKAPNPPTARHVKPAPVAMRSVPPSPPKRVEVERVESPPQSFTLQFADRQALERLVSERQVELLAITPQRQWQVRIESGLLRWSARQGGAVRYHEMDPKTVPTRFVEGLAAVTGDAAVTWGVVLPERIAGAIQRLITGRESGRLLIQADGRVVLAGEGR